MDPRIADLVRFLERKAGNHERSNRSECLKGNSGTHGPSIWSEFLKGAGGIHGWPNQSNFKKGMERSTEVEAVQNFQRKCRDQRTAVLIRISRGDAETPERPNQSKF